jgi:hypothetical protein
MKHVIEATILTEYVKEETVFIPRVPLTYLSACPFEFRRL